ncbi:type II toxin-antitoxin system RelE/ParE family toxin [Candidatus Pacearchaeota archaeon]|nr:type II toxin-antitoxin system RelE/ParE family toxin [Candidatus Pacearchaeota archaeon]
MSYRILPTKDFEKDFKKLNSESQLRIKKKIEEVAENPERYKHLHYEFKSSCRIRIGKLRVIFSYDSKKQELYLEKIVLGHKY